MRITPLGQVGIFLLVIVLAFFVAARSTAIDKQLPPKEAFQNLQREEDKGPTGINEVDRPDGPAPDALNEPRRPYHLLADVLPDAPVDRVGCLTAGCCNATDFEARTNLTGNYLQRTNNYKRGYPDSCTGPFHEFVLRFYKPETLQKRV